MDRFEELEQENVVLREHLSRLSQASLRINESLELDSVLQGVLDSAKLLTEALGVWNTPDGIRILEFLDGLTGPIRIPDVLGRFRAMGLPEFRPPTSVGDILSFMAAPVLN